MNLQDLKYFAAVAEHRHFGRAAEACNVSQPTLSSQVRKLEEELGVTLLERTNKRVELTAVAAAPSSTRSAPCGRQPSWKRWHVQRAIRSTARSSLASFPRSRLT